MRFCMPEKLTAIIGLNKDADNYAALDVLQDGMQATFEAYLRRELDLEARVVDVFFNGTMVPLMGLPVRSVERVTLTAQSGVIQGLGYIQDLVLTPNDYMITPYGIKLITYKANGNAYVTVSYTGGIASTGQPPLNIAMATNTMDKSIVRALEQASLQQIPYEWGRKDSMGAMNISTDGGVTRYPELDLLRTVKRVLEPYKHPLGGFV